MHLIRIAICTTASAILLSGCGTGSPEPAIPKAEATVRVVEFSNGADRPLPTRLYTPPPGTFAGRLPVVVYSHGYTRRPEDYDVMLKTWADNGFIVAAPTFPKTARGSAPLDINDLAKQPADVSAVITAVLALDTKEGDPLHGRVDATKIAAGGHSLGGMTTVGLFSSYARDTRVKAGIVMAGSARTVGTDYKDASASMLFVHGELDRVVTPADGRAAYEPFPGRKAWMRLGLGDHLRPFIGTDYELTMLVAQTSLDYLRWALHGDEPALKRLDATVDIESKLS